MVGITELKAFTFCLLLYFPPAPLVCVKQNEALVSCKSYHYQPLCEQSDQITGWKHHEVYYRWGGGLRASGVWPVGFLSMAPVQHKISDCLGVGEVKATTDMVGATELRPVKWWLPPHLHLANTSTPTYFSIFSLSHPATPLTQMLIVRNLH